MHATAAARLSLPTCLHLQARRLLVQTAQQLGVQGAVASLVLEHCDLRDGQRVNCARRPVHAGGGVEEAAPAWRVRTATPMSAAAAAGPVMLQHV